MITIDPASGKKIVMIDASAIRKSSCMRRLYLSIAEGWRSPISYNDTDYGTGFHLFAEQLAKTGDFAKALTIAKNKYLEMAKVHKIRGKKVHLTPTHFVTTCYDFNEKFGGGKSPWTSFKDPSTGQPLVEQKFSIPIRIESDLEISLAGTMDDLTQYHGGCVAIKDYKCTGAWDYRKFLRKFQLDPQLRIYHKALRMLGALYPDGIFGELAKKRIGAFIVGIFHSASKPTEFHQSEVIFFNQREIDEFDRMFDQLVDNLVITVREDKLPPRYGVLSDACNRPFECEFFGACSAPDDVAFRQILKNYFKQQPYNPLLFGGGNPEEDEV